MDLSLWTPAELYTVLVLIGAIGIALFVVVLVAVLQAGKDIRNGFEDSVGQAAHTPKD